MRFGAGVALMNVGDRPDFDVYRNGLGLGEEVEDLGFDSIWTVEHHFTGHSPVPNGLQMLSYLAGRTSRLLLGTAVIVLPWHNPIRVAEEIAVLDLLSNGRTILGLGRGAGKVEYAGFQIPMDESRERFAEAVKIIKLGLSQERFCYEGKFFQIPEISIRPRPMSHPEQRMYGAAVSPPSAELMAELGLGLLMSPQRELGHSSEQLRRYRDGVRRNGHEMLAPICHMYVSIHSSAEKARERAERYMRPMVESLDQHYGFSVGRLAGIKSYEHYARAIEPGTWNEAGKEQAVRAFVYKHMVGTPDQCIRRIAELREALDVEHFIGEFSYGGMPIDECRDNMRLFAKSVIPQLKSDHPDM